MGGVRVCCGLQGSSECGYARGDCTGPVTPETEAKLYECVGAQSCQLELSVGWVPQCRAYSDYNYVIYTCVASEYVIYTCVASEYVI